MESSISVQLGGEEEEETWTVPPEKAEEVGRAPARNGKWGSIGREEARCEGPSAGASGLKTTGQLKMA